MMRHKPEDFQRNTHIEIRPYAEFKQDKARLETRIKIDHLALASRRIADDYPDDARWYCLQVAPNREEAVEKLLLDCDVMAVFPIWKGAKVYRRGMLIARPDKPAMQGYVMVRMVHSAGAVMGLMEVDDVLGIVGGKVMPHSIKDKEMHDFLALCATGKLPKPEANEAFEVGDKVRVADGPFITFRGVVAEVSGRAAVVEIAASSRHTARISMPLAFLAKV